MSAQAVAALRAHLSAYQEQAAPERPTDAVAALKAHLADYAPLDEVGVMAQFVPEAWISELDEKVRNLDADQRGWFDAKEANPANPYGEWPWEVDWRAFTLEWNAWKASHSSHWSRVGSDASAQFRELEVRYNELLRQFQELSGGASTADKSDKTKGPSGQSKETLAGVVDSLATAAIIIGGAWAAVQLYRAHKGAG